MALYAAQLLVAWETDGGPSWRTLHVLLFEAADAPAAEAAVTAALPGLGDAYRDDEGRVVRSHAVGIVDVERYDMPSLEAEARTAFGAEIAVVRLDALAPRPPEAWDLWSRPGTVRPTSP